MVRKQPQDRLKKLGRFVKNSIEQGGMTVAEFAARSGFTSSSTVYQIVKATVELTYPTAKKISEGLRIHAGVKVSAEQLMSMIEPDNPTATTEAEKIPPLAERKQPEILPASAVVWHLQRIDPAERVKVWPELLKLLQTDFSKNKEVTPIEITIGRKPPIDVLISLIVNKADQQGLKTLREFTEWMFADSASKRSELALKGLEIIWLEKRLPYQHSPEFSALMGRLATVLDFQEDVQLLAYCSLVPQKTPPELEQPIDITES